jgi:hypothetical protein
MRIYARIQNGIVAELLKTEGDITRMFNWALVWVDVSSQADVAEGWHFDGTQFITPASPQPVAQIPSITELQAQLAALSAQIAALRGGG